MPQPILLPYHPQQADGYCLAACAQMVLHYWGIVVDQNELGDKLGVITGVGAPASRITRLASHQITPFYGVGEWETLQTWLDQAIPVIVMLQVGELSYWQGEEFPHAVVIVSYNATHVWMLDPAALPEPIPVSMDEFMLAWGELDYRYAVLMLSPSS
jgi:ABC-type bacteriocin/lantibiotic exporter with double-glycine peptidase domain